MRKCVREEQEMCDRGRKWEMCVDGGERRCVMGRE